MQEILSIFQEVEDPRSGNAKAGWSRATTSTSC